MTYRESLSRPGVFTSVFSANKLDTDPDYGNWEIPEHTMRPTMQVKYHCPLIGYGEPKLLTGWLVTIPGHGDAIVVDGKGGLTVSKLVREWHDTPEEAIRGRLADAKRRYNAECDAIEALLPKKEEVK